MAGIISPIFKIIIKNDRKMLSVVVSSCASIILTKVKFRIIIILAIIKGIDDQAKTAYIFFRLFSALKTFPVTLTK